MSNLAERRKYPRIDIKISIQGKDLRNRDLSSIETHSRNISEGGVRFSTNKFISLACRLVLELYLPAASKPIKAISKVAWIKKLSEDNLYDIGNQFLEMSKEDKETMSSFVSSKVEQK